jgi:hypothetical protein
MKLVAAKGSLVVASLHGGGGSACNQQPGEKKDFTGSHACLLVNDGSEEAEG